MPCKPSTSSRTTISSTTPPSPACASRSARRTGRRPRRRRPLQPVDLARQPEPVQLLHHRHGQGRDPGHACGQQRARRQLRGLHRRRRQGLLHRRQHQGIRRVLRRPAAEYRQYMRLFNDMVSAILACDKPVICRVNACASARPGDRHGLRFLVSSDLARYARPAPSTARRRSAAPRLPAGAVGAERAMAACCCASRSARTRPTRWAS